jgi:hypothetical protein
MLDAISSMAEVLSSAAADCSEAPWESCCAVELVEHSHQCVPQNVRFGKRSRLHSQVTLGDLYGDVGRTVQRIDALVDAYLEGVEFALVRLRDLLRNLALGDVGQFSGSRIEGPGNGVQRIVDSLNDLPIFTLVPGGIGTF